MLTGVCGPNVKSIIFPAHVRNNRNPDDDTNFGERYYFRRCTPVVLRARIAITRILLLSPPLHRCSRIAYTERRAIVKSVRPRVTAHIGRVNRYLLESRVAVACTTAPGRSVPSGLANRRFHSTEAFIFLFCFH